MEKEIALSLKNITKTFGNTIANDQVSLDVYKGEILSVLGENGCGKTTLMNVAAGIYYPDSGSIEVNGKEVTIASPKDAFSLGIGMIHQHFKLVDVFSAVENIVLGLDDKYDLKQAKQRIAEMSRRYGFIIDPDKKIFEMSVSEKQTLEIVKVLYRGADILILDEPTAVLTPREIQTLFNVIRAMKKDGKSVVIITHKLNEVMEISDRVAVLRKGKHIATVQTSQTNEKELTEMMVGEKVALDINRPVPQNRVLRLETKNLSVVAPDGVKVLDNINFQAFGGEILGIAGIAGSGQRQMLEAIAGLVKTQRESSVIYYPPDAEAEQLIGKSPEKIRELGVRLSFVPEDRLGMGLVGNMNVADNMMLRSYRAGHSVFLDKKHPEQLASRIIEQLKVVVPDKKTPVRKLSGGNVQKVLVGREISANPTVLMAAYPVRGLDINSSYAIYELLTEQKKHGTAVIFVGEDLDVLLSLCDRLLVVNSGKIAAVLDARATSKEEVGALMTKSVYSGEAEQLSGGGDINKKDNFLKKLFNKKEEKRK